MRILFLLLILLNLGYFMWQWPHQTNDKILPKGPIPVAPHSKTLQLLSEVHTPPAPKPAPAAPDDNTSPATPPAQTP
ncbi:MAG: hypothetical protein P8164_14875 [Gammaproteobacteria bacterium]|jgi:hypothetical protein